MRLFLALCLTLIVGLGAAFRPSDNMPGREVGAAESSQIVGGICGVLNGATCIVSNTTIGGCCLPSSCGWYCQAYGSACSNNYSIWACVTAGCAG